MKRTIKLALLACLILLVSALMFTACDITDIIPSLNGTTPEETTPEVTTPEETTPEITTPNPTPTHIWTEWIIIKEAKCEETGLLQRYCTDCYYTESKPIDAFGHTKIIDKAVAPTCTETGLAEGEHCFTCGEILVAQEILNALGHTVVIDKAVAPTCTENGLTAGKHCSCCGEIFVTQEIIPARGHTYNDEYDRICNVCGDSYTEEIVPVDFTVTSENRTMIGFTGTEGEKLVIPAVFENSGTWYKVTSIGASAFKGCSSLTSITIPDSVTSIGNRAFANCNSLTSATILAGITNIGYETFYYCSNLTSITIPSSVTSIAERAFLFCESLTDVYYSGDVEGWLGIVFSYSDSNPLSYGARLYCNAELVTEIEVPDSITSISGYAFYNCPSITSVVIGDNVTSIGDDACYKCTSILKVVIGDSVTSIGNRAFYNCSSIANVVIGNSVTNIGNDAFYNCYSLIEVCNKSSLDISVRSFDYGYIGNYAEHIVTDESQSMLKMVDDYLFYDDGTDIYLVKYFGNDTEITLPEYGGGKEYGIWEYAFYKNGKITSVKIPDSVTNIGEYAFYNCTSLASVVIGKNTTSIGYDAFYHCYSLIEVCNKSSLDIRVGHYNYYSIGYIGYYAKNIITDESQSALKMVGDYLFYDDGTDIYLVKYFGNDTEITLPEYGGGKEYRIWGDAFSENKKITSVIIPDTVTSIGSDSFYNCTSLTSVVIGNGVTSIGDGAFFDCASLTSVVMGNSVTSIGSSAFWCCHILADIELPNSLISIGNYAFYQCYALTSVVIGDNVTSIGYSAFYMSGATSVTFKKTDGWWCSESSSATSGGSISSSALADPSTAKTYLKSTYAYYYWNRTE